MSSPHIVLLDNHESFVYNLVDALAGFDTTVFRNTVAVDEVLGARPDVIVLSPGPGHPRSAGCMMELIDATLGTTPILGVCLGFQALLEYHGGAVAPCGPVHGKSVPMTLTPAGVQHPVLQGLATDTEPDQPNSLGTQIPVARYHSLGCTDIPHEMRCLAHTSSDIGEVVMAAETKDGMGLGLQFHPESVLTPTGPVMLQRCIHQLSTHTTMEKEN